MTIVYFMRHSEVFKPMNLNNNDSLQVQNEKFVLTKNGEVIAKEKSNMDELKNFDCVYSSNYVRAISTAKYFTSDNVFIDESFGERKFGINSWEDLPKDFGEKQFKDFDYKINDGESLNEVLLRQIDALNRILNSYKNKKILVVGHSTALAALFSKWCIIDYKGPYFFNGKEFFDGKWGFCETFKLTFDDENELVDIKNIE